MSVCVACLKVITKEVHTPIHSHIIHVYMLCIHAMYTVGVCIYCI